MKFLNTRFPLLAAAAATLVLLGSAPAHAYYSTVDNGEVLKEGQFQAMFAPQLIFNNYDGGNFTGRLDMGLMEGVSARGILGFGKVDFQIGGMVKWIPYPDTASQPAIGGEAGLIVARIGSLTQYSIRFHPLLSKKFELEIGDVIPYGSLPLGVTVQSGGVDETFVPVQLVAGAELRPLDMKNWSFFGEIGVNVTRSFGYVTAAIAYRFDDVHQK
ncbi:hypothetical protein BH10BDE1_BH10BDE1_23600 [soil metagenome]